MSFFGEQRREIFELGKYMQVYFGLRGSSQNVAVAAVRRVDASFANRSWGEDTSLVRKFLHVEAPTMS